MKEHRKLGSDGPLVSAIGYGAMGLEGYYGTTDEKNAVEVILSAETVEQIWLTLFSLHSH